MNNYYLLIYLKRFLIENILQGTFLFAISPHKDVLELYIKIDGIKKRIVVSTNSKETAIFVDDYRPPKKRNVLTFFDGLKGTQIEDIALAKFDRLITLKLSNQFSLLFKLYGHNPNILLIKNNRIEDAFKNPEDIKGQKPPQPVQPTFADEVTPKAKPKTKLTKLNPLLPRNLLKSIIKQHRVDEMELEEVKKFTKFITNALLEDPEFRVLKNGKLTLWKEEVLSLPEEKNFDSPNSAVRFAYRNAVHLRRLHQKKDQIKQFLSRQLKKKKAKYQQLLQADKSLERAERYEKYGHLLMTKAHESLKTGSDKLQIEDIYDNNNKLSIPVQSDESIAQNAEIYYEKAESSRKAYKKAKQRVPSVKDNVEKLKSLNAELDEIDRLPDLNKWIKQEKESLQNLGYGTEKEGQKVSPFRKFKVGKYEVWIGKNAKSNDKLTARAHKEDIWLHARGLAGSHTVIRMGNQKGYPPQKVVLRAASYAAFYSKAKGMDTAPVTVTKRKYVYKPKGASPGMVVVNREEVEIVPPMKPV